LYALSFAVAVFLTERDIWIPRKSTDKALEAFYKPIIVTLDSFPRIKRTFEAALRKTEPQPRPNFTP
jgi:hypothetical protein